MKVNRRRNITLTVRLTDEEKAHIVNMAKKANLSKTDYIVELSKLVPIVVPENVKPLLIELRRIGNNINQIATRANMDIYQRENFEGIRNELKKINDILKILWYCMLLKREPKLNLSVPTINKTEVKINGRIYTMQKITRRRCRTRIPIYAKGLSKRICT